ncbi:MAG: DUF6152 family protein [Steroidobacteraceae bacterium]
MKMAHGGRITLLALVALLAVAPAYAHHSALGTYDYAKTIKLTGVVVKYELPSPHVHITMDVKNSAGQDGNTLTIAYTVSDPAYLTKPYSETIKLSRLPDDTPMDFKCDLGSATRYLKK